MKRGVLLMNLGSPDSTEVKDVRRYLDEFLSDYLFPPRDDGSDPRLCPKCQAGRLSLRGGRFGAFIACSNYPECAFRRKACTRRT